MRYRILGPLEIWSDGRWISFNRTKWRVLLSVLLCAPNQVVSADRLLEELWGAELPRSARKLLQGYVSQLRKSLDVSMTSAVATHKWGYQAHGYQLLVQPDEVDSQRFERLFARGRAALAANLPMALGLLEEGLQLWRGLPFTDVPPTPSIEAETARLEELRLQAVECCIEARLRRGPDTAALAELEALVAAHPFRERLSGKLMWALYRTGRQADALTVYRKLRETLVDELGIEPSIDTRQLHQKILNSDTALLTGGGGRDWAISMPAPAESPRQLPSASGDLTGRDDELAVLREQLGRAEQGPAAVVIDGIGGVGKSALAIEVAHQMTDRFPGGHLYVNLHGATPGLAPVSAAAALRPLLRAVDPTAAMPDNLEEASARFRSRVAHLRPLLVLDNAYDADQVFPLLPPGRGCAALVTSRRVLATLDGAAHLHLDVLSEDRAVALLGRLVGQQRVAAEPEASLKIARLCDGLPLALRIASARLVARPRWSLCVFAERLADPRTRLDQLRAGKLALQEAFEVTYQALDNGCDPADRAAARVFRLLGMLDEPNVGVPLVAVLLEQSPADIEAALERLVDVRLAEEAGHGRYRLRGLLWLFARQQVGDWRPLKISELVSSRTAMGLMRAALCGGPAPPYAR